MQQYVRTNLNKSEQFDLFFSLPTKENTILLVLPFKEITIRPELSSPPRFRIQGVSPERYGRTEQDENPCL